MGVFLGTKGDKIVTVWDALGYILRQAPMSVYRRARAIGAFEGASRAGALGLKNKAFSCMVNREMASWPVISFTKIDINHAFDDKI
ncbi:MAG: hypothetical protein LBF58_02920 [Deltaproteobacteria bacterium]|jgi:hypothetical protein|nr:hypothetical protein [Deltaproteobacteria bacterium]